MQPLFLNKFLKVQSRRKQKKKHWTWRRCKGITKRTDGIKNLKVWGHRFTRIAYRKTENPTYICNLEYNLSLISIVKDFKIILLRIIIVGNGSVNTCEHKGQVSSLCKTLKAYFLYVYFWEYDWLYLSFSFHSSNPPIFFPCSLSNS